MIKKPKFIKNNEKSLGVLSSIQINFPDDSIFKFLNGRSFEVVWSKGLIDVDAGSGKIILEKIIFKTKTRILFVFIIEYYRCEFSCLL